ncbi:uncharacterized protein LOC129952309 [Eupeodes corollae]|uniref:uncharacterized protein LOC129952309 n=1 Tax=Eupeodes corollae TaxID=290404 RepID=UPI00249365DB|nr:uncharacterized protein LOC129952309 [Eupeodes corollae]
MHLTFVGILFVCLSCSASAVPCGGWNFDKTHDIIVTHPVQEEIILLTFVEDGPGAGVGAAIAAADENPVNQVQSDSLPTTDDSDDKQSGEVVDSAANKGLPAIAKYDPLPLNKTLEVLKEQTAKTATETHLEEVGLTTERGIETE